MLVEKDLPTVFFAQTFCAKNQLAKYLANKHNGLYIDIDGTPTNSIKAKIEAFIKVEVRIMVSGNFLDAGTTWSKILSVKDGEKTYKILKQLN